MQNFEQMAAHMNAARQQQVKETNDLMNATMSRCYAAFIAAGQPPMQAIGMAQEATILFGKAIGIIKEVPNNDGNEDKSSGNGGGIIVD